MNSDHIKKQLDTHLVPNIVRLILPLIKGRREKREYDIHGNEIDTSNIYGSGRRLGDPDKRRFLEISDVSNPQGTILAVDSKSGKLLSIPDNDREFLSQLRFRSIMLWGAPGSGKSNFLTLRMYQAFKSGLSQFYLDPKGDHTVEGLKLAKAFGYEFNAIRLREEDIHLSSGIDILKPVRKARYPEIRAGEIAETMLNYRNTHSDDNYWDNAIRGLLVALFLAVSVCDGYVPITSSSSSDDGHLANSRDYGTFMDVIEILRKGAEELDAWFCYMMEVSPRNKDILEGFYHDWRGDTNWVSHVSSLRKKLGVFAERGVAEIFSRDDVDIDDAVLNKSFLSIICDFPNKHFKPALTLLYELYILSINRNATRKGERKTPLRNVVILEELACAGVLEDLDEELAMIRSLGTQIICCAQSYPQIKGIYGEDKADSFFQVANLVYTGGDEEQTRKKIEGVTSTYGVFKETSSTIYGGGSIRQSESEQSVQKHVYDSSQLLDMPIDNIFFKLSGVPPAMEKAFPAYKHPYSRIKFVDKITGVPREVMLDEVVPGFDPDDRGLKLIGVPVAKYSKEEYEENHYLIKEE